MMQVAKHWYRYCHKYLWVAYDEGAVKGNARERALVPLPPPPGIVTVT